jgi:hypothetical protein
MLFDEIVSRYAFRKLNDHLLELQVWRLKKCAITWLLVTKISIERNIPYGGLTAALRCVAQSMVYWKGRGLTMTSLQIVAYEVNGL